ncbi:hypothetical protein QZH41_016791, partial [Actinostola sp. cb2023]
STMKDDDIVHEKQAEMINNYQKEIRHLSKQVQQMNKTLQDDNDVNEFRRKLASFEAEQAEKTRAFNEDTTKLQSQIAKLRSAVERGETTKQKLEYELALAHKAASQEKRCTMERETKLQKMTSEQKAKINELFQNVQHLEKDSEICKQSNKIDDRKYRQILSEKDKVIFQLQEEIKDQHNEQKTLSRALQEQANFSNGMEEKCLALEAQRTSQGEAIHKQQKELEFCAEREERVKKELEVLLRIYSNPKLTAFQNHAFNIFNGILDCLTLRHPVEKKTGMQYQNKESKLLRKALKLREQIHTWRQSLIQKLFQLRVRDLEGALEVEKSALEEAKYNMDVLNKQNRELESAFEEERDQCKAQETKILELEDNLQRERQFLSTEIGDKQRIIANMSKQLEVHQKNFEALKSELIQARKRQIKLDTTYGSSMRELELLLENFNIQRPDDEKKNQKKDKFKPPSPAQVLENLRHTMLDYQNRCSNASAELKRHREVVDKLASDCDQYKTMILNKDKTMKELDNHLNKAAKEVANARTECAEREATIASLKLEIRTKAKTTEGEAERASSIEDEVFYFICSSFLLFYYPVITRHICFQNTRLKTAYNNEDESRRFFLHSLYQRMITGKVYVNNSPSDSSLSRFSWTDMSNMVTEQIVAQMNELNTLNERVDHLEGILTEREQALVSCQETHEERASKFSSAIKERETSWKKQKSELEKHYNKIIEDLRNRSKKTQIMADKAWERIQETGHVKDTLEQQNHKLIHSMDNMSRDNSSLLAACGLLTGSLWPAYNRIRSLSSQRNILNEYANSLEGLRRMVRNLSEMLNHELEDEAIPEGTPPRSPVFYDGRHPMLVLRTAVIAVIATNRLRYFGHTGSKLFVSAACPGDIGGLSVVVAGGTPVVEANFTVVMRQLNKDIYNVRKTRDLTGGANAHAWLTSAHLQDHVVSALVELSNCLDRNTGSSETNSEREIPFTSTAIINAVRSSYSKLISRLQSEFSAGSSEESLWRDGSSDLVFLLGQGLHKFLASVKSPGGTGYTSSQQAIANLQGHILGFTQRLHTAEVERRSLRLELSRASQEVTELKTSQTGNQDDMKKARDNVRGMDEKIQQLKEQMLSMVPVVRFEGVCDELNNALKREQQAQALLNEQTTQMQEIGARLEMHSTQGEEKDATLEQAIRGLSEAKMDVRRQEHAVRQMNKQIAYLESEKNSQTERVVNAEKTLTAAAREKEALLGYLKSVERTLEQSIDQVRLSQGSMGLYELTLPKLMTPDEKLAMDGLTMGPEMLACQNVVLAFVEAQQQALDQIASLQTDRQQTLSRIAAMDEELSSHKAHIRTLKNELTAACRRQISDDGMSEGGLVSSYRLNELTAACRRQISDDGMSEGGL